jgi:hypothetical protein
MLGLNDFYLPRHPPKNFGTGYIGHELGDAKYVLQKEPDIIIFNIGSKPSFRFGKEMENIDKFNNNYISNILPLKLSKRKALIYFNKYSKKIGIIQNNNKITIPGYLLMGGTV